jgi:hypothetical protein
LSKIIQRTEINIFLKNRRPRRKIIKILYFFKINCKFGEKTAPPEEKVSFIDENLGKALSTPVHLVVESLTEVSTKGFQQIPPP